MFSHEESFICKVIYPYEQSVADRSDSSLTLRLKFCSHRALPFHTNTNFSAESQKCVAPYTYP